MFILGSELWGESEVWGLTDWLTDPAVLLLSAWWSLSPSQLPPVPSLRPDTAQPPHFIGFLLGLGRAGADQGGWVSFGQKWDFTQHCTVRRCLQSNAKPIIPSIFEELLQIVYCIDLRTSHRSVSFYWLCPQYLFIIGSLYSDISHRGFYTCVKMNKK